uniref:Uncharacterized protein n=1 Tax=Octopus bimaculoides TaxID=37653 RepID=A0A0L8GCC6_OCTBM
MYMSIERFTNTHYIYRGKCQKQMKVGMFKIFVTESNCKVNKIIIIQHEICDNFHKQIA